MGVVAFLPLQRIFNCHYLGTVESEVHTLTYTEAHPNFFFDHYNLNPIEDIENQMKSLDEENPFHINFKGSEGLVGLVKAERNKLINENAFLKSM